MPKIFLLLSAALLLLSSGLSFLNKNKLSASLTEARDAKSKVSGFQAEASKARTDLVKAKKDSQDAVQHAADMQGQYDAAKAQVTKLEGDVKTATDSVAAKDAQIDTLNKQIAAGPNKPVNAADPDAAQKVADLQRQKDELQLVKDSMETQLKGAQTQLAAVVKHQQDVDTGKAMLGLRGRVLAVNREYNFVVLDLGSRNGVSGNATMLVERGGSLVGKIRTVSVEPSQTVADIVPNSMPAGVVVQPGDTVIFPGS